MPFDKEKLPIPEPRRSEPLDEDAIRSQQAGGQPSNNLLVPSEVSLDDSGPEPQDAGFRREASDRPLARNPIVVEVDEDDFLDGDLNVGGMI